MANSNRHTPSATNGQRSGRVAAMLDRLGKVDPRGRAADRTDIPEGIHPLPSTPDTGRYRDPRVALVEQAKATTAERRRLANRSRTEVADDLLVGVMGDDELRRARAGRANAQRDADLRTIADALRRGRL